VPPWKCDGEIWQGVWPIPMKPLQSRRMIGRSTELEALNTLLAGCFDSNFAAAIISGDAGIGKSRLIREFLLQARAAGARTIVGNCVPLSSGTLPFGPFVEILRQARRWGDE